LGCVKSSIVTQRRQIARRWIAPRSRHHQNLRARHRVIASRRIKVVVTRNNRQIIRYIL